MNKIQVEKAVERKNHRDGLAMKLTRETTKGGSVKLWCIRHQEDYTVGRMELGETLEEAYLRITDNEDALKWFISYRQRGYSSKESYRLAVRSR